MVSYGTTNVITELQTASYRLFWTLRWV